MLKKIRISVSILFLLLICLYFVDFSGLLSNKLHFLGEIQLIPAILSLNWLVLLILLLLTFIFGRIYCSSVCPLGIYQDIVSWLRKRLSNKKHRRKYKYLKPLNILRWLFLGITVIAFIFGFTFLIGLLDPYSIFGRIMVHIFKPVYMAGNNILASVLNPMGNYTFYTVTIYLLSIMSTVLSLIMILLIGILSWNNGRIYCNTVCPVGTFLGLISKFSIYQIRFDKVKCTLCGKCARECKASCIDFRNMKVDTSRCINCFNCIEACSENGLQYKSSIMGHSREKADNHQHNSEVSNVTFNNRRRFLTLTFATSLLSIKLFADKVLHLGEKKDVKRKKPIMPPGAMDINKFSRQCTSCHLCVSKCPAQIIEPSLFEYGIGGIMQPMLNFTNQFCNYDCTICTDVCPTGALSSITKETKHHTQIGRVQLYLENCIVYTDETSCGACSEHCPTQAVHMIPYKNHLTIPEINQEICVGCGGCEFICPALPWKAIFVEGQDKHTNIVLEFEKKEEIELDDFGF